MNKPDKEKKPYAALNAAAEALDKARAAYHAASTVYLAAAMQATTAEASV